MSLVIKIDSMWMDAAVFSSLSDAPNPRARQMRWVKRKLRYKEIIGRTELRGYTHGRHCAASPAGQRKIIKFLTYGPGGKSFLPFYTCCGAPRHERSSACTESS